MDRPGDVSVTASPLEHLYGGEDRVLPATRELRHLASLFLVQLSQYNRGTARSVPPAAVALVSSTLPCNYLPDECLLSPCSMAAVERPDSCGECWAADRGAEQ